MKSPLFFALCTLGTVFASGAETWQPSPGHQQIAIWPGKPPDARKTAGPENVVTIQDELVAGKSWLSVGRVTDPTITVYSPKAKNTGVAMLVFPGGGYEILAIDLEGSEICEWLNSQGITGILLKYRVPGEEGYADKGFRKAGHYPRSPVALEDAQRAMGLVRLHAREWGIDKEKIGVIGFSAGGHLVAAISTHFDARLYPTIDEADKESCRPDFAVALYPGHLWNWRYEENPPFALNPDVPVTKETPPTFIAQAENDPVDNINHSLVYYIALKNAGVPTEMHLYAEGGHGFGLRPTRMPITQWPSLVERWLVTIGMLQ